MVVVLILILMVHNRQIVRVGYESGCDKSVDGNPADFVVLT
jgi:hypothetical protein